MRILPAAVVLILACDPDPAAVVDPVESHALFEQGGEIIPPVHTDDELRYDIQIEPHESNALIAEVRVQANMSVHVEVVLTAEGAPTRRFSSDQAGSKHVVDLVGVRASVEYDVAVQIVRQERHDEQLSWTTGPLPSFIMVPTFTVPPVDGTGFWLIATPWFDEVQESQMQAYLALDAEGHVVWYQLRRGMHALAEVLDDGDLLLYDGGPVHVVDLAGREKQRFEVPNGRPNLFHHDAQVLPTGNLLVLTREQKTYDVPDLGGVVPVQGDVIEEIAPTGEVVWRWSALDNLDPQRFPTKLSRRSRGEQGHGWSHGNALVYRQSDDSILVSLRHQEWVVSVDHKSGDVNWRLGRGGDFELIGGDSWFSAQHAPEWVGDDLLVYDNGNERAMEPGRSRAIRLAIDEDAMTAEVVWSFWTAAFTPIFGDVDQLPNGNVLVTAGGAVPSVVSEVDGSGQVVSELELMDQLYRAAWLPDLR